MLKWTTDERGLLSGLCCDLSREEPRSGFRSPTQGCPGGGYPGSHAFNPRSNRNAVAPAGGAFCAPGAQPLRGWFHWFWPLSQRSPVAGQRWALLHNAVGVEIGVNPNFPCDPGFGIKGGKAEMLSQETKDHRLWTIDNGL